SIAYGNGLFVAASGPYALYSKTGETWEKTGMHPEYFGQILFDGSRFTSVHRATPYNFSTSDNGHTWYSLSTGASGLREVAIAGENRLAAAETGAFFSGDRGRHWIDISQDFPQGIVALAFNG